MHSLPLFLSLLLPRAQAETPGHVTHVDTAPRLVAPSGKATLTRLAGSEEGASAAFFAILDLDAGGAVPLHRDATEEYIFFLAGAGTITIDGVAHEVRTGSSVFMPAKAEVQFQASGTEAVRVLQVFAGQGPEAKYAGWAPKE
jgi:quercetin dioxygenase-like cupin family protein